MQLVSGELFSYQQYMYMYSGIMLIATWENPPPLAVIYM